MSALGSAADAGDGADESTDLYRRSGLDILREQSLRCNAGYAVLLLMS